MAEFNFKEGGGNSFTAVKDKKDKKKDKRKDAFASALKSGVKLFGAIKGNKGKTPAIAIKVKKINTSFDEVKRKRKGAFA